VKRSAFGRLSGRQRSYADEVEGGVERQRRGNGRSHNKPPTGDSLREFVLHSLNARGARPAYETFPAGTSSPAGRSVKETLELKQLGEHSACLHVNKGLDIPHFPTLSTGSNPQQFGLLLLVHRLRPVQGEQRRPTLSRSGFLPQFPTATFFVPRQIQGHSAGKD
jgi:hypothetical protein